MVKARLVRLLSHYPHFITTLEVGVVLVACLIATTQPVLAVTRFQNRSLKVQKAIAGERTDYKFSFTYNTVGPVGSIDMLFCYNPIPTDPCNAPVGFDVSGAVLSSQTGETGYTITTRSPNHIVLSRSPAVVGNTPSTYTLSNVKNSTDVRSYAARLESHETPDATGAIVDLGSVITQMTDQIEIQTQVPPTLYFCLSRQVEMDCSTSDDVQFTDMGDLSPSSTVTAMSQMAVGTNASGGFSISVNGPPMQSGIRQISPLVTPTPSQQGTPQFGINLRANNAPTVGSDPDGNWGVAQPAADYNQPNLYTYRDGDVIASSPEVSLVRRFTVSYIVNVPADQRAGVYATTLTYICSGRF